MPTFDTPEPIIATLSTASARVRVTASDRTDTVVLVEPVDSANSSDAALAANTDVAFSGSELTVRTTTRGAGSGTVAITVDLPAGSQLVLNVASSDVEADGQLGDSRLEAESSRIQLDRVGALHASLAAGSLEIAHAGGPVDIQGTSGDVRISVAGGTVRYEAASGAVWLGTALGDVELSHGGGSFTIDRADGDVTATSDTCPIRIGRLTRGEAKLTNGSGGIEVGISEGTAAWVNATSTKGSVRTTLPAQDGPADFTEKVSVRARTRRDDIVIQRATG